MKKKYWIINSNKKNNQYWLETIMIDPNTDNYQENKDLYSETAIEAKQKLHKKIKEEIYQLDSKINKLEYKKKKLNSQLLNPEIRDEKYI